MIRVRFWGTRGSIATPGPGTIRYGGNTSCVEIRLGDQIFIMDAGTGIRNLGTALLREFDTEPMKAYVFISHTHWDHIQGFPFFMPAYQERNSLHLYGPPGRAKSLESILRSQMDADFFPVSLGDMTATITVKEINEPLKVGDAMVRPYDLNHPAMTLGYRVEWNGKSIVYATDNEPYTYTLHEASKHRTDELKDYGKKLDDDFVKFIANTDLLIAEAQYTMQEYEKKVGWGHAPIETIVDWASKGNVKQLALFHHDPMHDDAEVDAMVAHACNLLKQHGSITKCFGAREGEEVVVG